ncbi:hypothetical protein FHS42_003281 [Streptomyces zagrosensis]|uniref:Uncharacterized protein n=1 Tax=Streptomyces zagrosensis TaxID=1042984 RepID=A0A7W9Q9N9_9ACTN|nr:hypothetical protein [Streptomyces zagrosensis]
MTRAVHPTSHAHQVAGGGSGPTDSMRCPVTTTCPEACSVSSASTVAMAQFSMAMRAGALAASSPAYEPRPHTAEIPGPGEPDGPIGPAESGGTADGCHRGFLVVV